MISAKSQRRGDILQVHGEQFFGGEFGMGGTKGRGEWCVLKNVIFVKCVVTAAVRNITCLTRWQSPTPTFVINAVEAHDYMCDLAGERRGRREVKKRESARLKAPSFTPVLNPGALPLIFRQRLIRLTGNEWKCRCLMLANPLKSLASH